MNQYKVVDTLESPIAVLDILSENKTEMIQSELGFLCGLIRDHQPQKLVEVGVAAGGTTAVILNCIKELALDCQVYSVDLSEQYYRDNTKKTGYLADELKQSGNVPCAHQFLLGQVLPERLEEIGGGIDFLVLDTMHTMPGEVLDFIAAFPYLKADAVVVLHDTYYHYLFDQADGIATSVLFQSVTAEKYLNNENEYPNIAAFQLNQDTWQYMTDLFAALMIPWSYIPDKKHLEAYKSLFARHYGPECLHLFEQAVSEATAFLDRKRKMILGTKPYLDALQASIFPAYRHLLLYGAGKRGNDFLNAAEICGIKLSGFVVSDGQAAPDHIGELAVYPYSQLPYSPEDTLIIQSVDSLEIEQKLQSSKFHWLKLPDVFWGELAFTRQ